MGRFDALTQIEDKPKHDTPSPDASSISQTPQTNVKAIDDEVKKPEIMKSRNHEIPSPTLNLKDKPVKYSTLLDATLIKKIKLMAAEKESKDYEVIELALTEYFNRHS